MLNLARVWLDPALQQEGEWYHPQGLIGPSILPGFYDRKRNWHSSVASYVIDLALEQIVLSYLVYKPPVRMEEPYQIREVLSYCDSRKYKGTLYRASGFTLVRKNEYSIETYVRPVRSLSLPEQAVIAHRSLHDPRCKKLRETRRAASYTQLSWAST